MPRATNEKHSPKPYDRPSLEAMKRQQLQTLAKKEGIKANMKTEEIIVNLLMKREMVESILTPLEAEQQDLGRAGNASAHIQNTRRAEQSTISNKAPTLQSQPHTPPEQLSPQNDGQVERSPCSYANEAYTPPYAANSLSQPGGNLSPRTDGQDGSEESPRAADRRLAGFPAPKEPMTPPGPSHTSVLGKASNRYRTPTPFPTYVPSPPASPEKEPAEALYSAKMIRQYRREWATLRNKQAPARQDIADICEVVESTETRLEKQMAELQDLRCMRVSMENVLAQFRYNRNLYDGTGNMEAQEAQAWQDYSAVAWRPKALRVRESLRDLSDDSTADSDELDGSDGVEAYGSDAEEHSNEVARRNSGSGAPPAEGDNNLGSLWNL